MANPKASASDQRMLRGIYDNRAARMIGSLYGAITLIDLAVSKLDPSQDGLNKLQKWWGENLAWNPGHARWWIASLAGLCALTVYGAWVEIGRRQAAIDAKEEAQRQLVLQWTADPEKLLHSFRRRCDNLIAEIRSQSSNPTDAEVLAAFRSAFNLLRRLHSKQAAEESGAFLALMLRHLGSDKPNPNGVGPPATIHFMSAAASWLELLRQRVTEDSMRLGGLRFERRAPWKSPISPSVLASIGPQASANRPADAS